MAIINSNMITNRNLSKIYQSITFLSSEFIGTVFVTCVYIVFGGTVLVRFIDALLMTFIISSHTITSSSTTLFKYLLSSQMHMLGLQLLTCYTFYIQIGIYHYSFFDLNCMLYYRICIYNHIKYVLPMFWLYLFFWYEIL